MKVYLLRIASLKGRNRDGYTLGWKQSPSGTADGSNPAEGTPTFAEMATPGTVFEGGWRELGSPVDLETRHALGWKELLTREKLFEAANNYAGALIEAHKTYAQGAGLVHVHEDLVRLEQRLTESRQAGNACLLSVGWGGGLLSRVAWLKTDDPAYREIIVQSGLYGKSPYPGFPFPKTRRVVFLEDRPAALPGWGLLEVSD
jgi:CRISPR-associated protein Csm5